MAVVGADGSGKSAVSRAIAERLNQLGHAARFVDRWDVVGNSAYPSAEFLMNDIRRMRHCVADMPPHARFLFLVWTMALSLTGNVRPVLDDTIVVMDSYWIKHAAAEVVYGLPAEWVLSVVEGLPQPELTLFLRLPPDQAWLRKQADLVPYECGMDQTCSMEGFLRHQVGITNLLVEWSTLRGWIEIDASLSLPEVVETAVNRILSAIAATSALA